MKSLSFLLFNSFPPVVLILLYSIQPEEGMYCQPSCMKRIQNDETALQAEVGFYRHFLVNETTGRPYGCPGFDDDVKWMTDQKFSARPYCDLERYAPEGEPLYQIVEQMADDQQLWMDEFVPSLEKMLDNGYQSQELQSYPNYSFKITK